MNATPAPARAPAARGGTTVHAMVRILGHTVAIPGAAVVQAVEAPARLTQVPRRAGAIEGVMTLGRRLLPVISLARWLEPAPAGADRAGDAAIEPARGLVLLLEDGAACIGLAVEAVIGTQRVRDDQIRRLFHDDAPEELFQSAALIGSDAVPVSLLEPRRLMALAGVWAAASDLGGTGGTAAAGIADSARHAGAGPDAAAAAEGTTPDTTTAAQPAAGSTPRAATVSVATFRIADAHVALPAANVGELLRRRPLRRELLAHDGVLGLCEWRDRLVPVVDLAGALHALPAADEAAWLCIVCDGELAIGIVMHEVLDIVRMAPDAGTPDHAPAAERSVVGRRLVTGERTLQVIDVAALLRRYAETAISAKGARAAQRRTTADPGSPAYMVFDAGSMVAARIDGVEEVVPLPDELRPRLGAGVPTTLQWRRQAVPVVAIADSLVALPAGAARQLVVIRQGERLAALTIAGVKSMVPRGIAQRNRMRMQGRSVEVISVEMEDHRASYPVVDLGAALQPA